MLSQSLHQNIGVKLPHKVDSNTEALSTQHQCWLWYLFTANQMSAASSESNNSKRAIYYCCCSSTHM